MTLKSDQAGIQLNTLRLPADLVKLPLTTKAELVADQAANPPWGTALSEPIDRYTRYCQTSMGELSIEIELSPGITDLSSVVSNLSRQLQEALGITTLVRVAAPGSLPRFELKARRFVVE